MSHHRLLERQLRRAMRANGGDLDLDALLTLVSQAYDEHDTALRLEGHAHKLMSEELRERNRSLRDYQDNLESLIAQRTAELVATKEDIEGALKAAERATRTKSEFLANMSHEIRTPMNAVLGMANLLSDTELSPEQREWVDIIRRSGEGLLDIINDILDFSKIEAGQLIFETIPFDPTQVISDVTDLFEFKAHEKGVELIVDLPPARVNVLGDPVRLRQILVNLTGNALKFTQSGHVLIRMDARTQADGDVVLDFSVEDTGIGIPEDKQGHIFDKFTQAEQSTTRTYGGTGLGLAICRRLVEMMGGEIGVKSVLGQGSTFGFTLRLMQTHDVCAFDHQTLRGRRVLLIDDYPLSLATMAGYLQSWGIHYDTAGSAGEAEAHILRASDPYDFIICDRSIQDKLHLIDRIRQNPAAAKAEVVLTGSVVNVPSNDVLIQHGIRGILVKPVFPSQLYNALVLLLNQHMSEGLLSRASQGFRKTKTAAIAPDSFGGARVLVVEDFPINQKLIRLMLNKLGCEVDIAANGQIAAEAVQSTSYHLVLMDCQMPVMNGFEATAAIRSWEQANDQAAVPIVALTADAMQGDREKCLHAGMNDYLCKPINPQALHDVLTHFIKPGGQKRKVG